MGLLLFCPVWMLAFWQAWVYLLIFTAASALITAYLWKHDPKLLERRVHAGPRAEKDKVLKLIQPKNSSCLWVEEFTLPKTLSS